MKPTCCCHEPDEPCLTGWSDTHLHRCQPTADELEEFERDAEARYLAMINPAKRAQEPHNRPLSDEQAGDDQ